MVINRIEDYRIKFESAIWDVVNKILNTMYDNPHLVQIMKDIKAWDENTHEVIFRDAQSMNAFTDYLKKRNIIK